METLSLFRPVSNAAVSGFLSHTQSDWAETLLVGWAREKKSCFVNVILCNQVSNASEAVLPMTPQWYHGFTKPVWKQQIIASRQKRILRNRKKKKNKTGEKAWNQVPTCSAQEAAESPAACGAQGGEIQGETSGAKLLGVSLSAAEQSESHWRIGHSLSTSCFTLPFDYFQFLLLNVNYAE